MFERIDIHCNTIAQFKVLRHLQNHFEPYGITNLILIPKGIKVTDITGNTANFIFKNDEVIIEDS